MLTFALLTLLTAHEGEMPEPILVESITDLDTQEEGELEMELLTSTALDRERPWSGRLEAEWRATGHLGLMLEVGIDGPGPAEPAIRAGASFSLLHLEPLGLHAQVILIGNWHTGNPEPVLLDPAEPATTLSLGLHAGWRRQWFTVRAELTAGVGGDVAHLPIRANLALLAGDRRMFLGLESMLDLARADPWALAAEAELRDEVEGAPVRLGLAVPWRPRTAVNDVAVILRLLVGFD